MADQALYNAEQDRLEANAARANEQRGMYEAPELDVPRAPTGGSLSDRVMNARLQRTGMENQGAIAQAALKEMGATARQAPITAINMAKNQYETGGMYGTPKDFDQYVTPVGANPFMETTGTQRFAEGGEVDVEPQGAIGSDVMQMLESEDPNERISAVGRMMSMILEKLDESSREVNDRVYNHMQMNSEME